MQTLLSAVAIGASALGLAYALLSRLMSRARPSRPANMPAAALSVAAATAEMYFLTRFSSPPFSPGGTLGWGALAGGVLCLVALYLSAGDEDGGAAAPRRIGLLSAACLGPSLMLLLFRGYPNEAVMGCALGAAVSALLCAPALVPSRSATAHRTNEPAEPAHERMRRGLEVFALGTVTVAAGIRLGIEHFPRSSPDAIAGGYWAAPPLLLMAGTLMFALLPAGQTARRFLLAGAGAGLVAVLAAFALQARLLPQLAPWIPLAGLVAFGLALFALLQDSPADPDGPESRPLSLAVGSVLLALSALALAFRGLQGYGQAFALIPGLLLVAAVSLERRRDRFSSALIVGVYTLALLMPLHRIFLERSGRGRLLDFQQHYDVVALLLGALACFAYFGRPETAIRDPDAPSVASTRWASMLRWLYDGILLLAPLALAAVWGVRTAGAFLVGLVLSAALWTVLGTWSGGADRRSVLASPPHLAFAVSALAAAQLAPLVAGLELTRMHKLYLVGGMALLALIALAADAVGRARIQKSEVRDEPIA